MHWMTLLLLLAGCAPAEGPLVLNEFMARNSGALDDDTGGTPDWIELHNTGDEGVTLEGWYLSDNLNRPGELPLPSTLFVPADGYLLLYASGDASLGPAHLAMRLSSQGDDLILSREVDGAVVPVDGVSYGVQDEDVSLARTADGDWEPAANPSPGEPNP